MRCIFGQLYSTTRHDPIYSDPTHYAGVAKSRVYEISEMSNGVGRGTFKELTTVPSINKEFDGTPQAMLNRAPFARQYYSDAFVTYGTLVYTPGLHTVMTDKSQTYAVEADNAELRHYLARLVRRSRCFSRCVHALWRSVKRFVFGWYRRHLFRRDFPNAVAHVRNFVYP
jgi:hypothetical protein